MKPYPRTIVCPMFGPNDDTTLRCAGVMARTFGARLLLLKVIDKADRSMESPGTPHYRIRQLERLNGLSLPMLEGANLERYELFGEPTTGIRDFVINNKADMVVLGNDVEFDGLSALGPRTRRIAESLPCAVMIIKDPIREDKASLPAEASNQDVSDEELAKEFPISSWLLGYVNKTTKDATQSAFK